MIIVVMALAGGLGAVTRFVLDGAVVRRTGGRFPYGTVIINLTGSLLLGLVTGLAAGHLVPDALRLVVGTGFLGGYTTFSTASLETLRLVQERRPTAALLNGLGTLLGTVALAAVGFAVGSAS
jgi:fluoride exporter